MSRDASDDLLAEYMRVINHKDSEIHRLIAEVNRLELEMRKQEERHKAKLRELVKEVETLQYSALEQRDRTSVSSSQLDKLRAERDALYEDVNTLRSALQTQDAQVQSAASEMGKLRAQEAAIREKIETEYSTKLMKAEDTAAGLRDRCSSLESHLHRAGNQLATLEKDGLRWKTEAQRLQCDCDQLGAALKASRQREQDETVPRSALTEQSRQLEARHSAVVVSLEKEMQRLRDELHKETAASGNYEATVVSYRRRIQDAEMELQQSKHAEQEAEIALAHERLQHAQTLDEIKGSSGYTIASLTSQVDALSSERGKLQGELSVLQKRLREAEGANSLSTKRFTDELETIEKQLFASRQSVHELTSEVDAQKSIAEQRNGYIKELQIKLEALRSEYLADSTRLKSELEHVGGTTSRQAAALKNSDAQIADLRSQLSLMQSSIASERTEAAEKEEQWRARCIDLQAAARTADDEKRMLLAKLEDKVRELEGRHQSAVQDMQWKYTNDLSIARAENEKQHQKIELLERTCHDQTDELRAAERYKNQCVQRQEELLESQRDVEDKLMRLELQNAEKDGVIESMKRAAGATAAELGRAQETIDALERDLEEERHTASKLESERADLQQSLQQNRAESEELAVSVQRLEATAQATQKELTAQLHTMNERMRSALSDLHAKEQQLVKARLEVQELQQQHADECNVLQHEVLVPLQEKVEALVDMNRKLHAGIGERDAKIEDLDKVHSQLASHEDTIFRLQSELNAKERKARSLETELEDLKQKGDRLRHVLRERESDQDELRRLRNDNENLLRKVKNMETVADSTGRELSEMRARETTQSAAFAAKRAELSSLQERLANAESLKAIAEKKAIDAAAREADLEQQLEELRATHNTLQLCFQKQQQQLELGRRMREQDIKVREQEVRRQSPQEKYLTPPEDSVLRLENF